MRNGCREAGAALLVVSHSAQILDAFDRVEALEELNRAGAAPVADA